MNKKDQREPDRKYIFPNDNMVHKESERESKEVAAQKGPSIDKKDGGQDKK